MSEYVDLDTVMVIQTFDSSPASVDVCVIAR